MNFEKNIKMISLNLEFVAFEMIIEMIALNLEFVVLYVDVHVLGELVCTNEI